jgi:hypothetical protein
MLPLRAVAATCQANRCALVIHITERPRKERVRKLAEFKSHAVTSCVRSMRTVETFLAIGGTLIVLGKWRLRGECDFWKRQLGVRFRDPAKRSARRPSD